MYNVGIILNVEIFYSITIGSIFYLSIFFIIDRFSYFANLSTDLSILSMYAIIMENEGKLNLEFRRFFFVSWMISKSASTFIVRCQCQDRIFRFHCIIVSKASMKVSLNNKPIQVSIYLHNLGRQVFIFANFNLKLIGNEVTIHKWEVRILSTLW